MVLAGTFPESRVVKIWQSCLTGRTDLVTEDGKLVKIVYPGRINDDRGADLRDAVIATSRGMMWGDVEIHVKSSSWWTHEHHLDPAYNRVILHVVFWHDTERPINLQSGRRVPTLALSRFMGNMTNSYTESAYSSAIQPMCCRNAVHRWDTGLIGGILDTTGEVRFQTKAAEFQEALVRVGPSQCLYQGIMVALGYSKNKCPMMALAQQMPLQRLEAAVAGEKSDEECLARYQARLMGAAGLLPSQRTGRRRLTAELDDEWVERLERVWADSHENITMSGDDWHFFKVRPGNLPTRRIAAMSYLLLRYREGGIRDGLMNGLGEVPVDAGCLELERSLLVVAEGYWARNLDFCSPGGSGLPALLGRGRAADVIANVLLPYAAAWGHVNSRPEMTGKAFELYHRYPRLAENTLERHMRRQLGIGRYMVNTAQRQQGLIHIYKTYCSQGACDTCLIGKAAD